MSSKSILALATLLAALAAGARDYYVAPDGSGKEYTAAAPGNLAQAFRELDPGVPVTLLLQDGVYDLSHIEPPSAAEMQEIYRSHDKSQSRLNTHGEYGYTVASAKGDPEKCILDGGGRGSARALALNKWSTLSGLTFRNFTSDEPGSAVQGGNLISNCIFTANHSTAGGGALSACRQVVDCRFVSNTNDGERGGAILDCGFVERCLFLGNRVLHPCGLGGAAATSPWRHTALVDCVFEDNAALGADSATYYFDSRWKWGCALTNCTIKSESHLVYGNPNGGPYLNSITVRPGDDLVAAQRRLRRERDPRGQAEIVFEDGVYHFDTNTVLWVDGRDHYLTLRARHPGKVEFSGGWDFHGADFEVVTDAEKLSRLKPSARGKVVSLILPEAVAARFPKYPALKVSPPGTGFQSFQFSPPYLTNTARPDKLSGELSFMPTFSVGGRLEEPARWPNVSEMRPLKFTLGENDGERKFFSVDTDRIRRWQVDRGDALYFYRPDSWSMAAAPILGMSEDRSALAVPAKVKLSPNTNHGYFSHLFEELDRPGEWYFDRTDRRLYYYPRADFTPATPCSVALSAAPMLAGSDVIGLRLEGIRLRNNLNHPAIVLAECRNCSLVGCRFNCLGYGVGISGWTNRLVSCDFEQLAGGAFTVKGGDARTLAPGSNLVENCRISHCSLLLRCGFVSGIGGCGNAIRHCDFRHLTHNATGFGGLNMLIEYCRFLDTCSDTQDCASIGLGVDIFTCGGTIRYNDVGCSGGGYGIYPDDCSSGVKIYGNIVRDCKSFGIFMSGGRNLVVSNNLLFACGSGMQIDNRGLWWPGFVKDHEGRHQNWIKSLDYTNAAWQAQLPYARKWIDDGENMFAPIDNDFVNNLLIDCQTPASLAEFRNLRISDERNRSQGNLYVRTGKDRPIEFRPWHLGGWECVQGSKTNLIDLGFVDLPAAARQGDAYRWHRGNFDLRPDAWLKTAMPQFEPIPWQRIGLYADEWRTQVDTGDDCTRIEAQNNNGGRLYVSPDGGGIEYTIDEPGNLLEAFRVASAERRSTILLQDGVYDLSQVEPANDSKKHQSLLITDGTFGYTIASASGDPEKCILDGAGRSNARALALNRWSTVSGLTFRNFNSGGWGAAVEGGQAVSNCIFTANSAAVGGAIHGTDSVTDSRFLGNTADAAGALYGVTSISGCRFEGNRATNGTCGAVMGKPGQNVQIRNSSFRNNTEHDTRMLRNLGGQVPTNFVDCVFE